MARTVIRSGHVTVVADTGEVARTAAALRRIRADLSREVRTLAHQKAEQTVLPTARYRAPGFIAPTLVIRKMRGNAVCLTSALRGKRGRVVGLLERGGTVKTVLKPKTKRAIFIPGSDHPVALVATPRKYHGKWFMWSSVKITAGRFSSAFETALAKRWNTRIERVK